MLKKLNQNPRENLRSKFRDHPLMLTCSAVFHHYMADMEQFDFTEEDMFVEVAKVLDNILGNPSGAQQYISELWDDLKIDLKRQSQTSPPQADLDTVCGVLHYVVAATLSLHWHSFYKESLVGQIREIVADKHIFPTEKEQERIIDNLCKSAVKLDEWINHYDESSEWLSDEIALAINSRKDKDEDDFLPCGTTFTKTALLTDKLIDIIGQRLAQAHKLNASPDDWRKLFSGINQQFDMTWLGTEGELRDLFKMLTDKPQYIKPKRNFQLILKSHFLDEHGRRFNNLHGAKSIESFQPILDDCAFLLQHLTDSMTAIMKQLVMDNEDALREMGYFKKVQASKQAGLSIRNKRR